MYKNKNVAVVIPAHNEEKLIEKAVSSVPDYIDFVIVIDDASADSTMAKILTMGARQSDTDTQVDNRLLLIRHNQNRGVGAAICSGYQWCRDHDVDIAVVMAGDAQMDPADLPALLDPVVSGEADYAKGNRLFTGEAWRKIPKIRYLGNSVLSLMTKMASGYWHIADSQAGYTAINKRMLSLIDWSQSYTRYGCPNDYLVRLNIFNARVVDVPVRPVYGIGEKSGIRIPVVIPKITWLLIKLFIYRMFQKYVIRDFHPLVLFYLFSVLLFVPGFVLGGYLVYYRLAFGSVALTSALLSIFLLTMGVQFSLFAMWFDMEANRNQRR